jgi:hypothetical protein
MPEDRTLHNHRCKNFISYITEEYLQVFVAKAQENEDVRNEQNVCSANKWQFIIKCFSHLDRMNNDKRQKFALL